MMNDEQEISVLLRRAADPVRAVDIAVRLAREFIESAPVAPSVQPGDTPEAGGP